MSSASTFFPAFYCPGFNKCFIQPGTVQYGVDAGEIILVYDSYLSFSVKLQDTECTTITSSSHLPTTYLFSTYFTGGNLAGVRLGDSRFRSFISKSTCGDFKDMVTTTKDAIERSVSSFVGTGLATKTNTRAASIALSAPTRTVVSINTITANPETSSTPVPGTASQRPTNSSPIPGTSSLRPTNSPPTPNPKSKSFDPEVKIIIGVLMPVMIIIFLASGIIFLRKYGKRKSKNVTKEQSLLSGMVDYFFQQKPELCGEQTRHEVHEEDVRPEMADSARYELEADGFLHEMQVEERRQELGAEVPCFELQKG